MNRIVEAFHVDDPTPKNTFSKRRSDSTETLKPFLELLEIPTQIIAVRHMHVGTARPVREGLTAGSEHRSIFGQHLIGMLRIGEVTHYVRDQGDIIDFAIVEQLYTAPYQ